MTQFLYNSNTLSEQDFSTIRRLFFHGTGIDLREHKRIMVASRLAKRIRELRLSGYPDYIKYLKGNPAELNSLLNLLTTNVTKFFREPHHFEFLVKEFLPRLVSAEKPKIIRVWSAGCSSGQEAYSLAIVFNEFLKDYPGWSFRILASDINTKVLEKAASGIYRWEEVEDIPIEILKKHFMLGKGPNAGLFKIKDNLNSHVFFRKINLNEEVPDFSISGLLDIIFCRNVFIYFDYEHKATAVKKFHKKLFPGGCLFIGHSESLNLNDQSIGQWRFLKHTVYEKISE